MLGILRIVQLKSMITSVTIFSLWCMVVQKIFGHLRIFAWMETLITHTVVIMKHIIIEQPLQLVAVQFVSIKHFESWKNFLENPTINIHVGVWTIMKTTNLSYELWLIAVEFLVCSMVKMPWSIGVVANHPSWILQENPKDKVL